MVASIDELTPKLREVAELLAKGYTRSEISEMTFVTYAAVNTSVQRAKEILGVYDDAHLIARVLHARLQEVEARLFDIATAAGVDAKKLHEALEPLGIIEDLASVDQVAAMGITNSPTRLGKTPRTKGSGEVKRKPPEFKRLSPQGKRLKVEVPTLAESFAGAEKQDS